MNFQKLTYLQRQYAEKYAAEGGPRLDFMVQQAVRAVKGMGRFAIPEHRDLSTYVRGILKADARSYTPLSDFCKRHQSFFNFDLDCDGITEGRPAYSGYVRQAYRFLKRLSNEDWTREQIQSSLDSVISGAILEHDGTTETDSSSRQKEVSSNLMHGLRQIVMASRPGPPMSDCLAILGRKTALARLARIEQIPNA